MIRLLTEKDVDGILSLQRLAGFSDGWSENAWLSSLKLPNFFALGRFDDDRLIGYIAITSSIDSCDIELILVDGAYRRKFIASSLINRAEELVKEQGIKDAFIEVRESNSPARRLYERQNYKQINVRKRYYADGEDAIIYKKEL